MQQVRDTLNTHADAARQPISSNKTPKVAISFTRQGSYYIGIGKQPFKDVAQFRRDLEDYNQITTTYGFPLFMGLIDGIITELAEVSPIVTQLAIACNEMALAHLWKSWGIMPSVVIGHLLGEYAALNIAGVLSALDTILLVGRRAELLVANYAVGSHGMLAVRASLAAIEPLISHIQVERACINAPEELVFSGTVNNISLLRETSTVPCLGRYALSGGNFRWFSSRAFALIGMRIII
jgi:acyl transferase domain-containing protein